MLGIMDSPQPAPVRLRQQRSPGNTKTDISIGSHAPSALHLRYFECPIRERIASPKEVASHRQSADLQPTSTSQDHSQRQLSSPQSNPPQWSKAPRQERPKTHASV